MTNFKNIKSLGLKTSPMYTLSGTGMKPEDGPHTVMAADLEALLEKGVRVCGKLTEIGIPTEFAKYQGEDSTHTALLIGIAPIERDTAEGLLRELVDAEGASAIHAAKIIERAKRLLDKK